MNFSRQLDSIDCGPACIRMIAAYYGKKYSLNYLRNLSFLSSEGVSIAGIRDGLEAIGMTVNSFKLPLERLCEFKLPVILHWHQNHFVVLYKITKNKYYWIADPAYSKYKLSEEEFCKEWSHGGQGVILIPTPTDLFYQMIPPPENDSIKKFLLKYLLPFKNEMFQLSLGLLAGVIVSLIMPFLTQAMVDKGIGELDIGIILIIAISQLCLFLGSYAIILLRNWIVLYLGTRINIDIVSDFLEKIMRLPMKFFDTKSTGDFHQRIADHSRLQSFATSDTLLTVFSLLSFSVFFVIIGLYSLKVLIVYTCFTVISILWMLYFLKKRKVVDYKLFKVRTENQNSILEIINGMPEIKLNNFQDYKAKEWKDIQEKQYKADIDSLKVNQVQSAGYSLINQVRNITVTFLVAVSVVQGHITLGMMMSITYIIGQMNSPLEQLIGFVRNFQDSKISLERAGEIHILENEDNKVEYQKIPDSVSNIKLEDVYFRYGPFSDKMVLNNINLLIPKGKVTAIVGESGSGKTTLLKLLLKYYQQTDGEILIDNYDINNFSSDEWRKRCGIVIQESYIFSETILRNIVLGADPIDENRLKEAIKISNLQEFIENKPLKLYTKIGKSGLGISGGEKQRIMIARAVYKKPQYLFLDEATSSLDADNESIIVQNLEHFFKGRTVVIIAHRLSTVKNADQIVVLKNGIITEVGNHEQLIRKKEVYYKLVFNQLELAK
ncbi:MULTISPECIES: peptidase domain-containing ABC transporter [unclassified Dysgonomonas]|uniref:peptidase domain-containing ABC transporter n=1 Tax=unclassified Dysgonomonas TaxID=2630389 RepID=UPI0025BD69AC|nr:MULTISPECIES: peptidase domain-containing ABC transporter [unclassified Dysgonomonas]